MMEEKKQRRPGERILLWSLLAFSIFVMITALRIPRLENLSSAAVFPIFIAAIMIGCVINILWKHHRCYGVQNHIEEIKQLRNFVLPNDVVGYMAILLAYIFLTAPLHFIPSSFIFLVGSFIFLKEKSIIISVVTAILAVAILYVLFQKIFLVILW